MPLELKKDIRVLIVDDSSVVRKILARELNAQDGIEVVGAAPDPYVAREMIVAFKPDVLTLDIEMPRMDGITFLQRLMIARPMPVIVLSSMGDKGGKIALDALQAGAVEVVKKPGEAYTVKESCDTMAALIRIAHNSYLAGRRPLPVPAQRPIDPSTALAQTSNKVIAIGASTGGVQTLGAILTTLPANAPGIAIVQHMPPRFTSMFAERLNETCAMTVKEADSGDRVLPGKILIAPGGYHMTLTRSGAEYLVSLNSKERVHQQRPSVDVLFRSVAKYAGANAVGALLTGMGRDGAEGLLEMKEAGAKTIAQDEKSSIIFGMPAAAIKIGAADQMVSLEKMAETLLRTVVSIK